MFLRFFGPAATLLFLLATEAASQDFAETEITTSGDYYGLSSAVSQDEISLAHYDFSGALKYTQPSGANWSSSTVYNGAAGSPPLAVSETALLFDAAGEPHIFFNDVQDGDLLHAFRAPGGGWTHETVEAPGNVGGYPSAIRCAGDQFCLCYQDIANGDLRFAKGRTGSWTVEAVDSSADAVGAHCALAESAAGEIFVAHYDQTNKRLKVATRSAGGIWSNETVAYHLDYGMWPSVAIDTDGTVEIYSSTSKNSDLAESDHSLMQAVKPEGAGWSVGPADNSGAGGYPKLVFDGNGRSRVIYRALYTGGLFPAFGMLRIQYEQDDGSLFQSGFGGNPSCYPRYRYIDAHTLSTGLLLITAARDQNGACSYGIVLFRQLPTPTPTPTETPSATPTPEATPEPSPSQAPSPQPTEAGTPVTTCEISVRRNKGRKRTVIYSSLLFDSAAVSGAQVRIESSARGRSQWKLVFAGATNGKGVFRKSVRTKGRRTYRAVFAADSCIAEE